MSLELDPAAALYQDELGSRLDALKAEPDMLLEARVASSDLKYKEERSRHVLESNLFDFVRVASHCLEGDLADRALSARIFAAAALLVLHDRRNEVNHFHSLAMRDNKPCT